MQNLAIQGGHAFNGGILGTPPRLGGGLLINDAAVTLANVLVQNNEAHGALGATGAAGVAPGSKGNARQRCPKCQWRRHLSGKRHACSLERHVYRQCRSGRQRGPRRRRRQPGHQKRGGRHRRRRAARAAKAVREQAAGSTRPAALCCLSNDSFRSNQAVGGPGGDGGTGGSGGHGSKPGGVGGAGGSAGPGFGAVRFISPPAVSPFRKRLCRITPPSVVPAAKAASAAPGRWWPAASRASSAAMARPSARPREAVGVKAAREATAERRAAAAAGGGRRSLCGAGKPHLAQRHASR